MEINRSVFKMEKFDIKPAIAPVTEKDECVRVAATVLEDADEGVHGYLVRGHTSSAHVQEKQEGFLRQTGLSKSVGEGGVGWIGGRQGVVPGHPEPEGAELGPPARAGEVSEEDAVVDRVWGVARERAQTVEQVVGAAPVALPREERRLLARGHGCEGIIGWVEGGGGGVPGEGGCGSGDEGVVAARKGRWRGKARKVETGRGWGRSREEVGA
jgi:hypothetical protein